MNAEDNSLKYIESTFLLQNSPAVTYVCKAYDDFAALFITDNIKAQMGYSPDEFINEPSFWADHIHPEDKAKVFEDISQVFEHGYHVHEYRFLHADGNYCWMRDELKLIKDEAGQPKRLVGYWIDISQRKQTELELIASNKVMDEMIKARSYELEMKLKELAEKEKQLLQAQKIEALGQLTGGIAHDFNNTIGIIAGFSEVLLSRLAEHSDLDKEKEYVQYIVDAARRSSDLVKKMLAFSRKELGEREIINVNEFIGDTVKLLRATIPVTINIEVLVSPEPVLLNIDSTHLSQLIMNLVINSKDAIKDEKGQIEIGVNRVTGISNTCCSCQQQFEGDYVEITVSDDGEGMDENDGILGRIFDPFFSTKDVGKGTGMGLSVVHGIVHANKGHLLVSSEQGKGSKFSIFLPEVREEIKQVEDSQEVEITNKATGRILVVDDEPSICSLLEELLLLHDFEVETFMDPRLALENFKQDPDKYDLIVTDQTMPNLSGKELAIQVLQIKPVIPVIMCTGHSDVINEEKALEIGVRKFLKKPINTREFINVVNTLLKN